MYSGTVFRQLPTYTIFAYGTEQGAELEQKGVIKKNIISEFAEVCHATADGMQGVHVIEGVSKLGRTVTTLGIEKEVDINTVEAIKALKAWKQKHPGQTIKLNMVGFSRGAVTCLKIINAIANDPELMWDVIVDIFSIDPVAGTMDKTDKDATNVPPIVRNYVAPVQLHESDSTLRAQAQGRVHIQNPAITHATYLPFPGNHTASMIVRGEGYDAPGILLREMLHDFLIQAGTKLSEEPQVYHSAEVGKDRYKYQAVSMQEATETAIKMDLYKSGIQQHLPKVKSKRKKKDKAKAGISEEATQQAEEKAAAGAKAANEYIQKLNEIKDEEARRKALRLDFFAHMRLDEQTYSRGTRITRSALVIDRWKDYEDDPEIFYNKAHSQLFKDVYPCAFVHFFRPESVNQQDLQEELIALKDTKVEQQLQQHFNVSWELEEKGFSVPKPAATHEGIDKELLERLANEEPLTKDQAVKKLESTRWESVRTSEPTSLEALVKSILDIMRGYQSKRPWWRDLFGFLPGVHRKNLHHDKADTVCHAIHEIMRKKGLVDDKELLEEIDQKLKKLYKEDFKELKHIGNSKFIEPFKRCLVLASEHVAQLKLPVRTLPAEKKRHVSADSATAAQPEQTPQSNKKKLLRFGYVTPALNQTIQDKLSHKLQLDSKRSDTLESLTVRSPEDIKQFILYIMGVVPHQNTLDSDLRTLVEANQLNLIYESMDFLVTLKNPNKTHLLKVKEELMQMHLHYLVQKEKDPTPQAADQLHSPSDQPSSRPVAKNEEERLLLAIRAFIARFEIHGRSATEKMAACAELIDEYFYPTHRIQPHALENTLKQVHNYFISQNNFFAFFNRKNSVDEAAHFIIRNEIDKFKASRPAAKVPQRHVVEAPKSQIKVKHTSSANTPSSRAPLPVRRSAFTPNRSKEPQKEGQLTSGPKTTKIKGKGFG